MVNVTRTCTLRISGGLIICLAFACLVLPPSDAAASGTVGDVLRRLEFAVEPSMWYSLGEAGFKGDDGEWSWKLVYPLDGWVAEIRAESRFPFTIGHRRAGVSVRARHARSIRVNVTSTDTDWDSLGIVGDYSESDCEADISMWDIDAAFSVHIPQHTIPVTLDIGALAGYGVQSFGFTDTNLHVTVSDHSQTDYYRSGVNAYYNMEIRYGRLGAFGHMLTHEKLRCYLEATYVPYLEASGDAYWVLREYRFWQAAGGKGYTLTVRADYDIWDYLSISTSLRRVSLVADDDGLQGGALPGDHYEDDPILSEITSKYFGVEVGAALRF